MLLYEYTHTHKEPKIVQLFEICKHYIFNVLELLLNFTYIIKDN